jgi:hypothetical protein
MMLYINLVYVEFSFGRKFGLIRIKLWNYVSKKGFILRKLGNLFTVKEYK